MIIPMKVRGNLQAKSTGPNSIWYKGQSRCSSSGPKGNTAGYKLYVESLDSTKDYGFCVAEDTGGAIKGNKIDLFFNTAGEVKQFGRRKVKVYILD